MGDRIGDGIVRYEMPMWKIGKFLEASAIYSSRALIPKLF
jgi:hypothetical protein